MNQPTTSAPSTSSTPHKPKIGVVLLTCLVIGTMIGSGIFTIPSALAGFGPISILAWVTTAAGALLLNWVFTDLNRQLPNAGGPYVFAREAYGDFMGFATAYCYWIAWGVGNAGIAVSFSGYLEHFLPIINPNNPNFSPLASFGVKAGMIWLMTIINMFGIRKTGYTQLVTVLIKIMPLIVVGGVGLFFMDTTIIQYSSKVTHTTSHISAFLAAMTITLWAFIGFEAGVVSSEHATNARDIKIATYVGTTVTAILYIVGSTVIMGLISPDVLAHSDAPFTDAAKILFNNHPIITSAFAFAVIVSTVGAVNSGILLMTEVGMSAARDNLFIKSFEEKSRFDTPIKGYVISGIFMTAVLLLTIDRSLVKQFTFIVLLATFAYLIPYLISGGAELVLLLRQRETMDKKRLVKSIILTLLATTYAFATMIGAGQENVFYGMMLFFSAFIVYPLIRFGKKTRRSG